MPCAVSNAAHRQSASGTSPIVRSVPGPRKRIASKPRSLRASARACNLAVCARQAATGSGSSSRVAVATASQRRSTSGSPKTCVAQPVFGAATIVQLTCLPPMFSSIAALMSRGSDRPTSAGSRSFMSSGVGLPVNEMSAGFSVGHRLNQSRRYGADHPISDSGPSSTAACRTWRSEYRTTTCCAPARYASRATARAISACSTRHMTTTS